MNTRTYCIVDSPVPPYIGVLKSMYRSLIDTEYKRDGLRGVYKSFYCNITQNMFLKPYYKLILKKWFENQKRMRWLCTKFIYKLRGVRKKNSVSVNSTYLDLSEVSDPRSDSDIRLLCDSKVFTFSKNEMVNLFETSLRTHDYGDPIPKLPSNPYTQVEFKMNQIVYIFDLLALRAEQQHISNKSILTTLYVWCKYDFNKFREVSKEILLEKANKDWVKNMSKRTFFLAMLTNADSPTLRRVCPEMTYDTVCEQRHHLELTLTNLLMARRPVLYVPSVQQEWFN